MNAISHRSISEAPPVWRGVLFAVFLGRGAVAGAAVALALLGAVALLESAATVTMITIPMVAIGTEVLNVAAAIGALLGAAFQAIFNR